MCYHNRRLGFSLIELLVVIGIIMLLAGILFPIFATVRERGRQTKCMSNQHQLSVNASMYAHDHDMRLPDGTALIAENLLEKGTLICPTAGTKVRNPYVFNSQITGMNLADITEPGETWVTADGQTEDGLARTILDVVPRHSGRVVLSYVDGHVGVSYTKGLLPGASIFSDDFTSATLDPAWNATAQYQLTGGTYLRYKLTGPATSTEGLPVAAPSISRQFTGTQWVLIARLVYRLHNRNNGAAISAQSPVLAVAFDDNATNVACTRTVDASVPTNTLTIYGRNTPSLGADQAQNLLQAFQSGTGKDWLDDTHYYRITRDGQAVKVELSQDGSSFTTVRNYTISAAIGATQTVALDATVSSTAGSYVDWDYINVNALN